MSELRAMRRTLICPEGAKYRSPGQGQASASEPDRRPGFRESRAGVRANRFVSRRHCVEDAIQPRIDSVLESSSPVRQVLRSDEIVVALPTQGCVRLGAVLALGYVILPLQGIGVDSIDAFGH